MDLPSGAPTRQRKRTHPTERAMEKCEACRQKKIKCLPTSRDWTKGEICNSCAAQDASCGPNTRAGRSTRSRTVPPATILDERPLLSLDGTSPRSLERSPTIASGAQRSGHAESGRSIVDGSNKDIASESRSLDIPTGDDGYLTQKTSIESSFSDLGSLRMNLKNVMNRLETLNSNASGNQHPSTISQSEMALEILASSLHSEHTNVLKHVLVLIEDTRPGPSLELALKRTLEAMERYAQIATTSLGLHDTPGSQMTGWRSEMLERLFEIYTAKGDYTEAEEYAQKLDSLHEKLESSNSETTERLAHSLKRTSRRMRDVLNNILILPKYRDSLHLTNSDHFPPVHRAMLSRNTKVVRFLCESAKQILHQEDILRRGTLHIAAETANEEVLSRLYPQIPELLGKRDKCLKTPLCVAAEHGDYDFFEKLAKLSSDADLTSKDAQGRSVLTLACSAGHFRIVEYLLQKNVSPNDMMVSHCSPLNAAASSGHGNICRVLLNRGAWVDWISQEKTAIEIAKEHGRDHIVEMISEYQSCPQNLFVTSHDQRIPSAAASERVHISAAQPTTPQRPSLGLRSPPPSYGPVYEPSYYDAAPNMDYETTFDLVKDPG